LPTRTPKYLKPCCCGELLFLPNSIEIYKISVDRQLKLWEKKNPVAAHLTIYLLHQKVGWI